MKHVLAIDLGGTSIKFGIVDQEGNIFEKESVPTPRRDFEKILNLIKKYKLKHKKYSVDALTISAPGAVNMETAFISGSSAIPCIHGVDWRKHIKKLFGDINFFIGNDASVAALGEIWKGGNPKEIKNSTTILYVIGSGIGGGIVNNGKLLQSKNPFNAEFGYAIWGDNESNASSFCSAHALETEYLKIVNAKKTAKEIVESYNTEFDSKRVFDIWLTRNAKNLISLTYIMGVDNIIIAGGLSQSKFFIDKLKKEFNRICDINPGYDLRPVIRASKYEADANLIGAASLYFQEK